MVPSTPTRAVQAQLHLRTNRGYVLNQPLDHCRSTDPPFSQVTLRFPPTGNLQMADPDSVSSSESGSFSLRLRRDGNSGSYTSSSAGVRVGGQGSEFEVCLGGGRRLAGSLLLLWPAEGLDDHEEAYTWQLQLDQLDHGDVDAGARVGAGVEVELCLVGVSGGRPLCLIARSAVKPAGRLSVPIAADGTCISEHAPTEASQKGSGTAPPFSALPCSPEFPPGASGSPVPSSAPLPWRPRRVPNSFPLPRSLLTQPRLQKAPLYDGPDAAAGSPAHLPAPLPSIFLSARPVPPPGKYATFASLDGVDATMMPSPSASAPSAAGAEAQQRALGLPVWSEARRYSFFGPRGPGSREFPTGHVGMLRPAILTKHFLRSLLFLGSIDGARERKPAHVVQRGGARGRRSRAWDVPRARAGRRCAFQGL